MTEWTIIIRCLPHSTGQGAQADQEKIGPEIKRHYADAEDIFAALDIAKAFAKGIESNPMVWETQLVGIVQKGVSA